MLRVRNVLDWSRQQRAASPLTGLPGNHSINDEIRRRLGERAAVRAAADRRRPLQGVQRLLRLRARRPGDPAARAHPHRVGASSTAAGRASSATSAATTSWCSPRPTRAEALGEAILDVVQQPRCELYDSEDRERGHVEVLNRRHVVERFPLMSLTIALVSTDRMPVSHLAELIDIAQELKAHGKGIPGSVLVGERRRRRTDRRRHPAPDRQRRLAWTHGRDVATRARTCSTCRGEALALLAEAVLALRTTGDLGVSWGIASATPAAALGASDARLLRVDRRSGALFRVEESGVETPYLAEHGGPVEWVMRNDRALLRRGRRAVRTPPRETLLWHAAARRAGHAAAGRGQHGATASCWWPSAARARSRPRSGCSLQTHRRRAGAGARARGPAPGARGRARAASPRLERRLAAAQEAASALMSIVAHELRSPLIVDQGLHRDARAATSTIRSAPRERFLGIINDECDRLARLVSDVHDLSRIESGECTLRLVGVSLRRAGPRGMPRASRDCTRAPHVHDLRSRRRRRAASRWTPTSMRRVHRATWSRTRSSSRPRAARCSVTLSRRAATSGRARSRTRARRCPPRTSRIVFERFYRARRAAPPASRTRGGHARLGLAIARGIVAPARRPHVGRAAAAWPASAAASASPLPARQLASARARRIARQTRRAATDLRRCSMRSSRWSRVSLETRHRLAGAGRSRPRRPVRRRVARARTAWRRRGRRTSHAQRASPAPWRRGGSRCWSRTSRPTAASAA